MISPSNLPSPAGYSFGAYDSPPHLSSSSSDSNNTTSSNNQCTKLAPAHSSSELKQPNPSASTTITTTTTTSSDQPASSRLAPSAFAFTHFENNNPSLHHRAVVHHYGIVDNNISTSSGTGATTNATSTLSCAGGVSLSSTATTTAATTTAAGGPSTTFQKSTPASLSVALCRSLVLKYIYMTYLFLFHLFVVLPASALTKVSRRARLVLGIESKSSSNSHNSSTVTSQQNSSGVDTDFEEPSSSSSFSTSFSTPSTSLSLRGFFRSKKAVLDSRNNNNNGMDGVGEKFLKQYTQDNHLGSTTTTTTATTTYSYGHRNSGLNGGNVGGQDGNNSMLRRSSRFKSKSDLDEFAQSSVMAASAAVATAPGATGGGISVNNTIATARRPTPSQAISHGYGTDSMAEDGSGDNSATPRSSMASVRLRQRMGRPSSGLGSPGSSGMTAGSGSRKKTLVLDLDETLIHSTSRGSRSQGYMVEVLVDRHACLYYVYKRPHVDYFLKKVAEWYKLVIFTASMAEYADPVIDWLDQSRTLFDKRYFRQACYFKNGSYLKDLTVIEPDLSSVCLLDNSPISYSLNKENGIPIDSWINDPNDEALLDLLPFLDALRFTEDVRSVLSLRTV